MIRTSEEQLRITIRKQYISMLAETTEKKINELGRLMKRRLPPPVPGADVEELHPDDIEMMPDDMSQELEDAQWMSHEPDAFAGAGDTQTTMKRIDIDPREKRPLAKRFGLKEEELRSFISSIIKSA